MEKWRTKAEEALAWIKQRYLLCMLIINVVWIALAGIQYGQKVSDLHTLEFTQEQLEAYTTDGSIAGSINEDSTVGMYDIIPGMVLEKGYYSYTVKYQGSSAGSFCLPYTNVAFYDVMEQVSVGLDGSKAEETRKFWVNADLDIALKVYYSGSGSVTFTGFVIEETDVLAKKELFSSLMWLVLLNLLVIFAVRRKENILPKNTKYAVIAIGIITLLASYPSLTGYIMDGHDIKFHLARIEGIREGLLSGQFPVRIAPTFYNGYGYANPIFYGELFLYFPALLRLVGFSVVDSYNVFLIAVNLFTAIICYYSCKKIFIDDVVAMVTTLLYVLCPYRLMDIYTRAAIGEVTAIMFLPLVVYGLYRIFMEDTASEGYKHVYLPLVLGLTGIVQSHVITGEIVGGVILLVCVILCFKTLQRKRLWALVKTVVVTVLLNAWFLIPFADFTLTQDVRVFATASADFLQHTGAYISQLFSVFAEYALLATDAGTGVANEMPINMGLALGLGVVLFVAMFWVNDGEHKAWRRQGLVFLFLTVITTWMATIHFPWDRISTTISMAAKLISSIQFVWRFVGVASVLAMVVTGYGLLLLHKQEGKTAFSAVAVLLVVLGLIQGMSYNQTMLYNKTPLAMDENSFVTENNTYYASAGEYVLCDVKYEVVTEIFEPGSYDGVLVTEYEKNGTNIRVAVTNDDSEGYILLPLINYKGYEVSSEDGSITNAQLQMGEGAVIRVNIPANYEGTLFISYEGCWYWRVAELITLFTVVSLIYMRVKHKRRLGN